ncbi:uncharacterized protein C11orf91 homolog [Hyla sarda]|uniref:uncharacterized protein C11orf91 homolog n=1 Tax=Hyla sarda TaxID=327740 RepID=UPI0024C37F47|nr:uncharacterized protein C11orf91 homolog [Hyla sarda]
MATAMPVYFPSLYDESVFNSPETYFNIWKKLGITFNDNFDIVRGEVSRWPPGLADLSYNPMSFFSTHYQEDLRPRTSFSDKLCELEIQLKEIELLSLTEDWCDGQKYNFLKAKKEQLIHYMKGMQAHEKTKQASLQRKVVYLLRPVNRLQNKK